ncbi:MAG: aldehyde ferredoxin oxidoreductase family protein [Deltaproteobacteria bacterium]|nr:aldehyde ferredoxin oxidoreductase family protein [Deltaproteobacteria bacterium]
MTDFGYGYAGKILRVDLSTGKISTQPTEDLAPRFLGGRGINQWILLQELAPWVTPFEPANIVCYGAGALAGTLVPGACRINVDSKNAFTGGIGSGSAGGWFASELKFAGYDHVVVRGKAREPVYLWIEDDRVAIKPANSLWGKTVRETEKGIRDEAGHGDAQVLCIGPAGENLVRSACIIVSGCRAVGRCGLGAVMGSKNLKAIAVRGTGRIAMTKPDQFLSLARKTARRLRGLHEHQARKEFGSFFVSPKWNDISSLPYKNYHDDFIPDEVFSRVSHEVFHRAHELGPHACTACPTHCGHTYQVAEGPYAGTLCHKAEANAVWNFGGRLAMADAGAVLKAQEDCCQLGLDIDNTTGSIAWAMDCFEQGILSEEDAGGLRLAWGDHRVVIDLIRQIANREGLGNLLAEGSLRASQVVGKGSERYAFHMKGQDLIEAIRAAKGWALGVVVSARGGAHTRGAAVTEARKYSEEDSQRLFGVTTAGKASVYEGKPLVVARVESICALLDSVGVCFFTGTWGAPLGVSPEELAKFCSLATGVELTEETLMKTAERIHNVEKMFNVVHARFTREDDYPPARFMVEPIQSGSLKGEYLQKEAWDGMLDAYYALHGWDRETGWPTREKLEELDLPECVGKLGQAEEALRSRKRP